MLLNILIDCYLTDLCRDLNGRQNLAHTFGQILKCFYVSKTKSKYTNLSTRDRIESFCTMFSKVIQYIF